MRSDRPSQLVSETIRTEEEVSFRNYKINYSRPLGSGVFGTVYEVCSRPENEKGLLSYWFPYIYDYVYPANNLDTGSTKYCVKIFKSTFRILQENSDNPNVLQFLTSSMFEPTSEKKSNNLLHKYGISKICFFKTNSLYSQFKTRVNGKTLQFYAENNYFTMIDQFLLRMNFINFVRLIKNSKLSFKDVHAKNIMYDEKENRWEIIDGDISEKNKSSSFFHKLMFSNETTEDMISLLVGFANSKDDYTREIDVNFLTEVTAKGESKDLKDIDHSGQGFKIKVRNC